MDEQMEIEIPEQPKSLMIYCECLKGQRALVALERSVSDDYLMGKCGHCGKMHTRRAA